MEAIESMPESALDFYTMLFRRKRYALYGTKRTTVHEAKQSWYSLSESEKEVFTAKYNKIQAEHKQKIANSLKNVTPYLKKKTHRGESPIELKSNGDDFEFVTDNIELNNIEANTDKYDMSNENVPAAQQNETNDRELLNQHPTVAHQLEEPAPPILKTGKELFEYLSENEKKWVTLSKSEKRYYQQAILTIKKKYLKSYQLYLESLTPIELYNHYINKIELE